MNVNRFLSALFLMSVTSGCAVAQSSQPTALRKLVPEAFVLFQANATGVGGGAHAEFSGGKNTAVAAGLDVGFYSFGSYLLGAEFRGSFPITNGTIVGERSVAGGARLSRDFGAHGQVTPYVDALFGRGQMDYQKGGYISGNLLYQRTASNLYGGGGGVNVGMTDHFSLKVDAQATHWSTPVVTGGSVWSKQLGVGVVYRIGAGAFPTR